MKMSSAEIAVICLGLNVTLVAITTATILATFN